MERRKEPSCKPAPSSCAIIRKGAQGISSGGKAANEKSIVLASTQRAMRLRNGKGGSFGLGEMVKLSGRDKLELIAEDEMERAKEAKKKAIYEASLKNSLRAPFNLEISIKVAQSQMDAYIDVVNALHKSDFCYDVVYREIQAQCPPNSSTKDSDPMQSASFVAEQFAVCVHNAYMLASGWCIMFESLKMMQVMGLADRIALEQLKSNGQMRTIYLSAFNLLKKLVASGQQRLRSIVQNTEHYHVYFKASGTSKDRQEFADAEIRKMYKSFLDSTIVELCLPGSRFTPLALYSCLNVIESESPKELRRCPQIMWDAVGDLAESVRLLDLMETPLLNNEGDFQAVDDPDEFEEFALWNEAQGKSIQAALQYSSFVNLVYPLINLKNKSTLEKAWDRIDANYVKNTGKGIDLLWQLNSVRIRIPHFSILFVPGDVLDGSEEGSMALVRGSRDKKKQLAITANGEDGSDSSMPGLVEVSNTEDEDLDIDSMDTESSYTSDDDDSSDGDDDEGYDTEEEEELRKLHREAMNIVNEVPEILDLICDDKYSSERKKNPFLKLLGNLRGRMFSPSSALRTDGKTTATSRPSAPKAQPPKKSTVPKLNDDMPALEPLSAQFGRDAKKFTNVTVEDADNESDEPKNDKKKKKPKKKKKKTSGPTTNSAPPPKIETPSSPKTAPPVSPPLSPNVSAPPSEPRVKTNNQVSNTPSLKASSTVSELSGTTAFVSTATLPLPVEQKAESARSYISKLGEIARTKVKTRPEQPLDPFPEKERHRLFPKLGEPKPKAEIKAKTEIKQKSSPSIFGNLKKKTGSLARKLFGVSIEDKKGALKWEQFLQIMRELGFKYDPSTAGSSVRFDPPNPNDRSISFHKPHPDPTLHQNRLKQYRDKLAEYYDWSPEKFQRAMDGIGNISSDGSEVD